jgi:hypothetical protein
MSKYFSKIIHDMNVIPLQIALRRMPGLFGKYNERCIGESPHRESEDLWIRYNKREAVDGCNIPLTANHPANEPHRSVWYPAYYQLPQLRPIIFDLMGFVEGEELGTVLMVRLAPGKTIYTHRDGGWAAGYYEKYFIPVQTGPGSVFNFPDGSFNPQLGEVYWFDNSVPHSYENQSNQDTIMLIVVIRSDVVVGAR